MLVISCTPNLTKFCFDATRCSKETIEIVTANVFYYAVTDFEFSGFTKNINLNILRAFIFSYFKG